MSETNEQAISKGDGYAVANLSDLGEGPGFRKIRKALGVTAFGVNAIVLPPPTRPAAITTTSRRSSTSFTAATSQSSSATAAATSWSPAA